MLLVCWNWHGVAINRGGLFVSGGGRDTFCFSLLPLLVLPLLLLLPSFLAAIVAAVSLTPLSLVPAVWGGGSGGLTGTGG